MIYTDDPTIKEIFRRIEYLENKVRDLNLRTLPVTSVIPTGAPPVPDVPKEKASPKPKTVKVTVDPTATEVKVSESEKQDPGP